VPVSDQPVPSLRKQRLPRDSREVTYVLKHLKEKRARELKIKMADIRSHLDAAKNRSRSLGLVSPPPAQLLPDLPKKPANAKQALAEAKKRLAPSYEAMRYEIEDQRARLRSMRKNRDRLFGAVGDPTLLDFLDVADTISATTSPLALPVGGSVIFVLPPSPTTSIAPFSNQVRFSATMASQLGYMAEIAWLQVTSTYVFSFISPLNAVCTLSPAFLPNGVFTLTAPQAVYFFPWYNAVPHAYMDFDATVQADIWLPGLMPPSPPAQTVTGISVFPAIGLSGWTGFQTASGGLTPGAGSSGLPGLTLPPFLVIAGARVVISIQYFLEFYLTEGGFATFDAATRSGLGLNVPYVLARFDY
jgi:hypothetical protein